MWKKTTPERQFLSVLQQKRKVSTKDYVQGARGEFEMRISKYFEKALTQRTQSFVANPQSSAEKTLIPSPQAVKIRAARN